MVILPEPKTINEQLGYFLIDAITPIILPKRQTHQTLRDAKYFQRRVKEELNIELPIITEPSKRSRGIRFEWCEELGKEQYSLKISDSITLSASGNRGWFYGLMTLLQIIRYEGVKLPFMEIQDEPYFAHRGVYYDVTRGKVPTLETLKEMIDVFSEYKINEMQLYIEHSFLFEELSEIFRDKDALSAADIMELDRYAAERHIELIPSLATFGHMYEILRSQTFSDLSEKHIDRNEPFSFVNRMAHHTLDVSHDKSIELSKYLIESFIPLFQSDKFNICGDETFDLGRYKNKELAEEKGVGRLYVDYLKQLIEIVQQNGKQVMFWGDIIVKHPELLKEIPQDVICLNWGYSANETSANTELIAKSGVPQYVCPSTTGWNRMINWYDNSSVNIRKMVTYAKENNAYGILNTDWGDHGHVNLLGSSYPMFIYGAALAWNPDAMGTDETDDPKISASLYGKSHSELFSILRRISQCQPANWSYINFHLEREYGNPEVLEPYYPIMEQLDVQEIMKAIQELPKLKEELLVAGTRLPKRFDNDFNEWLVMTDLMLYTQEAFLFLMKYEMNVSDVPLSRSGCDVASDIEYAVERYKKVWRIRNRESELNRVTHTFYELADRARRYHLSETSL
ncbi:hypothetical protein VL4N_02430 [Vagococcus lutrae]|uniref:beta-N-acetylhexosaminidase n=1 Tax=Vagococcus lutrae TaxID=81947 RepID=UPI001927D5D7|nr:family 20 glycosylhydrolase [Vagococcus lutrae]GEQ60907.1 hypothetical protein VL2N_02430 [Vagococcus lutrae]GEQ62801.1 hypothetical protein VL3N_02430 [Vagococcus lutrae]GEQ64693.1 hypothetical protein VL4N_02430 [Vagococcus lutrae]